MIWRLPHPIRGILAFLTVFVIGALLGAFLYGFGIGIAELAFLGLLSCVAFVIASREASSA